MAFIIGCIVASLSIPVANRYKRASWVLSLLLVICGGYLMLGAFNGLLVELPPTWITWMAVALGAGLGLAAPIVVWLLDQPNTGHEPNP